ncbi:ATP-binding cassette transporter [Penicillium angulare]|uniref:ATP-binding cassette transporter n=1 Tax=Penicillium angulare TaxID=116970 RepID=A0A9W9G751_9EURO|nr:ATP-binding cassette transporter [Penicillium angulare]
MYAQLSQEPLMSAMNTGTPLSFFTSVNVGITTKKLNQTAATSCLCISDQMRKLDLDHKQPLFTPLIEWFSGLVTIRVLGWALEFTEQSKSSMES